MYSSQYRISIGLSNQLSMNFWKAWKCAPSFTNGAISSASGHSFYLNKTLPCISSSRWNSNICEVVVWKWTTNCNWSDNEVRYFWLMYHTHYLKHLESGEGWLKGHMLLRYIAMKGRLVEWGYWIPPWDKKLWSVNSKCMYVLVFVLCLHLFLLVSIPSKTDMEIRNLPTWYAWY